MLLLSSTTKGQNGETWTYKVSEGKYIYKMQINGRTEFDTIILYTPILNIEGTELDTLHAVQYSEAFQKLGEPLIYRGIQDDQMDLIRLAWFKDTIPVVFRIEKKDDSIKLIKKKSYGSKFFNINSVETINVKLSGKEYEKILKKLSDADPWSMNPDSEFWPPDVLIETRIDGNYHFINEDNMAIRKDKKYSKIFKLFSYLDNLKK